MKLILVVFSILVLGFSALAANDVKKTEAGFFGPGGCEACETFTNNRVLRNSTEKNFTPRKPKKPRNTDQPRATTDR